MLLPSPPLLVISDRTQARLPLPEVAKAAFEGGCRWFSVREKDLPRPDRFLLQRHIGVIGGRYEATVMEHGEAIPQQMLRVRGMHLPSGGDIAGMRARVPDEWLVG